MIVNLDMMGITVRLVSNVSFSTTLLCLLLSYFVVDVVLCPCGWPH